MIQIFIVLLQRKDSKIANVQEVVSTMDKNYFKSGNERKKITTNIIKAYFSKLNKEKIILLGLDINKNHVKITFKMSLSVNLPIFISNLKSVTSRSTKNRSPFWQKRYLIVSEN